MKLPVGFIADTHIHPYKNHSTTLPDGMNSRMKVILDAIMKAGEMLSKVGGKSLFIAGDVFHVRGSIKPSVLTATANVLSALGSEYDLHVYIIPGNHDMENLAGGATSVDMLNSMPNVEVIHTPSIDEIDGWKVGFIPYVNSTSQFNEIVGRLEKDIDFIVCHQGIDDFKPYAAMPDCGVTTKTFPKNLLVFAGHYHNAREGRGAVSIGAITQHDFSSENEDRGMWILDKSRCPKFYTIESPRFVTIDTTSKKLPDAQSIRGNYIRILAKTVAAATKARKLAEDVGAASIVVQIEKEFTKSKTETIKMDTLEIMISQFIDISSPKYDGRKSKILDAYRSLP